MLATRRLPAASLVWRRAFVATAIAIAVTVGWGLLTGHGAGGTGNSPGVSPFNEFWRDAVAITMLGAGAFLAIGVAWFMVRREATIEADLYLGTAVILVTGALAWGARLGDLILAHLLVAGIAVFAMPATAVAVWSIWCRLRTTRYRRRAVALLVLSAAQMEFGVAMGVVRLQSFGPNGYDPVPVEIISEIKALPPDAKLAYACQPSEEVAFWESRLIGVDAHTGRRVVPMCFETDTYASQLGAPTSADIPGLVFTLAPQRSLYPDSTANPTPASVTAFLRANGIHYIYADSLHPNSLVPAAIPTATSGETQILRIP